MKTQVPLAEGALEFVANSINSHVAEYRERAAQLRQMAHKEPSGRLRDQLLDVAVQYDELAASTEIASRLGGKALSIGAVIARDAPAIAASV